MQTVGQIIRERREQRGLTLAVLAQAIGATKGYLSMIENHRVPNPPSIQLLTELERALDISEGELLRAAAWQNTPAPVKERYEQAVDAAQQGMELARWLKSTTDRRGDGAKGLDKLHKSGELARRIEGLLGQGKKKKKGTRKSGDEGIDDLVPMRFQVPVINRVAAGYPRDFTDLEFPRHVADDYVSVPGVTDPDAFAARVVGDSMQPDYREGDIVVFSPAAKVIDGCDCFVRLEPDHETTFKRVFMEKTEGQVRLQPLNSNYPPRLLDREQIAGMYRAVWRFSPLP